MKYGYTRVSTDGRSAVAQAATLNAAGAGKVTRGSPGKKRLKLRRPTSV
jgi:hypothetical protein